MVSIEALREQKGKSDETVRSLAAQRDEIKKEFSKLKKEVQQSKKAYKSAEGDEKEQMKTKLKKQTADLRALKAKHSEARKKLAKAKEESEKLSKDLESAVKGADKDASASECAADAPPATDAGGGESKDSGDSPAQGAQGELGTEEQVKSAKSDEKAVEPDNAPSNEDTPAQTETESGVAPAGAKVNANAESGAAAANDIEALQAEKDAIKKEFKAQKMSLARCKKKLTKASGDERAALEEKVQEQTKVLKSLKKRHHAASERLKAAKETTQDGSGVVEQPEAQTDAAEDQNVANEEAPTEDSPQVEASKDEAPEEKVAKDEEGAKQGDSEEKASEQEAAKDEANNEEGLAVNKSAEASTERNDESKEQGDGKAASTTKTLEVEGGAVDESAPVEKEAQVDEEKATSEGKGGGASGEGTESAPVEDGAPPAADEQSLEALTAERDRLKKEFVKAKRELKQAQKDIKSANGSEEQRLEQFIRDQNELLQKIKKRHHAARVKLKRATKERETRGDDATQDESGTGQGGEDVNTEGKEDLPADSPSDAAKAAGEAQAPTVKGVREEGEDSKGDDGEVVTSEGGVAAAKHVAGSGKKSDDAKAENNVAEAGKDTAPVTVSATDTPESPVEEEKTADFVNVQGAETEVDETKSDEAKSDEAKSDEAKSDEAKSDEAKSDEVAEVKSDETKSDEAKSDEAKSDEAKSDEAKSDEAKSDEAKSDEAKSDEANADEAYGEGGEVKVDDTKQDAAVAVDSTSAGAETKNDSPGEGELDAAADEAKASAGGDGGVEANERSDVDEYVEEDEPASVEVERPPRQGRGFLYARVLRAKLGRATADVEDELSNVYSSMTLLNGDDQISCTETKLSDQIREPSWETLIEALDDMRTESSENLIEEKRSTDIRIDIWGVDRDATNAILLGTCTITLDHLMEMSMKNELQSRWMQLDENLGSIRLCFYYSPDFLRPKKQTGLLETIQRRRKSVDSKAESKKSKLSVFVGTWNLSGKEPPPNISLFIPPEQHDLYFIATQECGASIETSVFLNYTGSWEARILKLFGDNYVRIDSTHLTAIHGIALIRKELVPQLSRIESSYVATGIANVIGNKGGIALSFDVGNTSFLFISCHFHAFQAGVELRNADYHALENRLKLRNEPGAPSKCSQRFDRVFWAGDLNYRCLTNRSVANCLLREKRLRPLLQNEQLLQQMKEGKVFGGFVEAEIKFKPTYKFDVGTSVYDTSVKQRVPSWTDRILWKDSPDIECTSYTSTATIRTSDHKPVGAVFNVTYKPGQMNPDVIDELKNAGSRACAIQ